MERLKSFCPNSLGKPRVGDRRAVSLAAGKGDWAGTPYSRRQR